MRRRFHPDKSITPGPDDPIWGEHELRWRWGKPHGTLQVNHWPYLRACRTPDGGWRMFNMWVEYVADAEVVGSSKFGVPGSD